MTSCSLYQAPCIKKSRLNRDFLWSRFLMAVCEIESRKPIIRKGLKVGATRFERATSCSQSRRSSQAELRPEVPQNVYRLVEEEV